MCFRNDGYVLDRKRGGTSEGGPLLWALTDPLEPFTKGNVYNLRAVVQALKMDKLVVVLRHGIEDGQKIDFTENGDGLYWYNRIIQGGGQVLEDLTELLPFLADRMEADRMDTDRKGLTGWSADRIEADWKERKY
ncbi:MAG: hypothetical protein AB1847_19050 [bacterium]